MARTVQCFFLPLRPLLQDAADAAEKRIDRHLETALVGFRVLANVHTSGGCVTTATSLQRRTRDQHRLALRIDHLLIIRIIAARDEVYLCG